MDANGLFDLSDDELRRLIIRLQDHVYRLQKAADEARKSLRENYVQPSPLDLERANTVLLHMNFYSTPGDVRD